MSRDDFAIMMEFLKARLHEDEKAAQALKPGKNEALAELRARVLADVEAKRRLMDWVTEMPRRAEASEGRSRWQKLAGDVYGDQSRRLRSPVICELVAAYEGHPDFRDEWRLVEVEDECEPAEHGQRR
ncbi:DUF6221 family protein [Streptomyces pharetrae]|uniref:DUF6221 family protein n=1 Tax=Streptomyces pharetrae TaxID=291370 RepID=UPI00364F245C